MGLITVIPKGADRCRSKSDRILSYQKGLINPILKGTTHCHNK